jgi:hypothetical protein
MIEARHHRGYSQSKPRMAVLPEVPACPICQRRPQDGHDSYCTQERRANAEAERLAIDPPAPMVVRRTDPTMDPEDVKIDRRFSVHNMPTPNQRKERPMPTATLERVTADLGLPAPSVEPIANAPREAAQSLCQKCGPQDRYKFSDRKDGTAYAICRPCKAEAMRAHRVQRTSVTPFPAAILQEVAETAYAAMTEPPVIDRAEPATMAAETIIVDEPPAPPEPVTVRVEAPAPIDHGIDPLEQRLRDLRDIRTLMGDTLTGLLRWQRLVGEAITRKQAEMGA